ncbi:hypothetical protein ES705_30154 [subsurface metagenome]
MERESHLNTLTVNSPDGSSSRKHSGLSLITAPLSRAERTPEVAAVSGICGEGGESLKTLSDFPRTNLPLTAVAVLDDTPGDHTKAHLKSLRAYYLDYEATSPADEKTQSQKPTGKMCGSLALVGATGSGKRIAKRICCGREPCERCREQSHQRRIARVLPRLFQIDSMAYIVITWLVEVRPLMRNPKALALLGKRLRGLLRRRGYRKIYTRWHPFGDTPGVYHPHLNVICDGEYLEPEQLADLKNSIRCELLPRSMAKLYGKDLVIHYDYTQDAKRKMHWIKYVSKATFLEREWDEELASALYGFHNGCFAGTWNDTPKWRLTGTDKKFNALARLGEGLHPESGEPVTWDSKPLPWVLVKMENPVHIGGWWYTLPPIREPPGRCRSP